jgi:hypothetical protein
VFSPVKVRFSVTNWTRTLAHQRPHQPPKIVEIACQPVHRVHDDGVAVPVKREQRLQLRHTTSLPDDLFREHSIQLDIIELAIGALIQGTDPNAANSLSRRRALQPEGVRLKSENLAAVCPTNPIRTLF